MKFKIKKNTIKRITISIVLIIFSLGFLFINLFWSASFASIAILIGVITIICLYLFNKKSAKVLILLALLLILQLSISIIPGFTCDISRYNGDYKQTCNCIGVEKYPFQIYGQTSQCIGIPIMKKCYNITYPIISEEHRNVRTGKMENFTFRGEKETEISCDIYEN